MHVNLAATAKVLSTQTLGQVLTAEPQAAQTYAIVAYVANTNHTSIAAAVEDLVGESFAVLPGTAVLYAGNFIRASIAPRLESIPYEPEHIAQAGLHVVSANVFMDAADNAWSLVGDRLVKTTETDYDALAQALVVRASGAYMGRSDHLTTARNIAADRSYPSGGSYAYFVTPEGALDFGVVVAKARPTAPVYASGAAAAQVNVSPLVVRVVSRSQKRLYEVPASAVLEYAEVAGAGLPDVDFSTAPIEDYYAQLFGKDSGFYKALEDQIRAIFS
jgi:hypothetical protein